MTARYMRTKSKTRQRVLYTNQKKQQHRFKSEFSHSLVSGIISQPPFSQAQSPPAVPCKRQKHPPMPLRYPHASNASSSSHAVTPLRTIYFLVVKSVSRLEEPLSARPQLHASSVRFPQAQADESEGSLFSVTAFSQVH
jgi:hypothetical protein